MILIQSGGMIKEGGRRVREGMGSEGKGWEGNGGSIEKRGKRVKEINVVRKLAKEILREI